MRTIRTVVAALVAAASLGGIPSTASADTRPACSSVPFTAVVPLTYQGLWTYTFTTTWCVEKSVIIWAEVVITHEEYSDTCTWSGRLEEATTKDKATGTWTLFDMSGYSCKTGGGSGTKGITPWAMVAVHPDGTSEEIGKGFE